MHAALMLTFVGCALSGLPLLYSEKAWAAPLARILGGFESAGFIHRICAFVMILVFVSHVVLVFSKAIAGKRLMAILWGPDSMVPQPQDAIDVWNNFKWFVGRGPQPSSTAGPIGRSSTTGRCSGGCSSSAAPGSCSGFPCSSPKLLPGWMFNIAALVHGEEALLAAGFIFTFHFFNGHVRPAKFPMDVVIFTAASRSTSSRASAGSSTRASRAKAALPARRPRPRPTNRNGSAGSSAARRWRLASSQSS